MAEKKAEKKKELRVFIVQGKLSLKRGKKAFQKN